MEKLSMGEYTAVVWAAYLVALLVLGGIGLLSVWALRKAQKTLADLGNHET